MISMLESGAAYILDVFTEVFVWYGNGAERTARRGAGKVANQLLRAVARPRWAEDITHVREAREPFLFRVKFFDWGVAPRRRDGVTGRAYEPINCITSFHKNVRTIAEVSGALGAGEGIVMFTRTGEEWVAGGVVMFCMSQLVYYLPRVLGIPMAGTGEGWNVGTVYRIYVDVIYVSLTSNFTCIQLSAKLG